MPYDDDLAAIHDAGFGELAEAAARELLAKLAQSGVRRGLIIELGCGPGVSSRIFTDAGFDVLGFDISPSMVERARRRVPEGEFRVESFTTAELPPCAAVTAFGEVLNYAFDSGNDEEVRARLFARVHAALAPRGLFLFDVAGPERPPCGRWKSFQEGGDWAVLVKAFTDSNRKTLTRQVVSFRRDSAGDLYRRREEIHPQRLLDPRAVGEALTATGFATETQDHYGEFALPTGLTVFCARPAP